jgi:hypothetical protein
MTTNIDTKGCKIKILIHSQVKCFKISFLVGAKSREKNVGKGGGGLKCT